MEELEKILKYLITENLSPVEKINRDSLLGKLAVKIICFIFCLFCLLFFSFLIYMVFIVIKMGG